MYKILIVEDEQMFRDVLKTALKPSYDVTTAENGIVARDLVAASSFDLIISDIQMPLFSGLDLLAWVKQNKPTPVILMTGFSHVLETKMADELGAIDFLAKPFPQKELLEKVKMVLKEPATTEVSAPAANLDLLYCKLPIEDFISQKEIEFPIFLRISQQKYIKIAHKGGKLPPDRIAALKERSVHFLYIQEKDFCDLVGFTVNIAKVLTKAEMQIDQEKKNRFLKYTGEMIAQSSFVSGLDEASFQSAKDFLELSMRSLTSDPNNFELLSQISNHGDFLYSHSLAVSMVSVLIGKGMGWTSPQTLFKLATAGLYHDIGKKEIDKDILKKPRPLLTSDEVKLIETHATRGKEILEALETMPGDISQIVYEHHENALGQGYPRHLMASKIHPLSHVVITANAFCNYASPASTQKPMTAQESLEQLESHRVQELDKKTMAALRSFVKNGEMKQKS
jgi:putative nucleotidyltransferase with HDIG domain